MSARKLTAVLAAGAALAGCAGATLGQDAKARLENSRAGQAEAALFANNSYWYNPPGWRPGDTQPAGSTEIPALAGNPKVPFEMSRAGEAAGALMRGTYHFQDSQNR